MELTEAQRLADLSEAVRESSLKRFRVVPPGSENWRPAPGTLTIAQIARHLLDADHWLFEKMEKPGLPHIDPPLDDQPLPDRGAFNRLLEELVETGNQRAGLLRTLGSERLALRVSDSRYGDRVTLWWVIVRGNLDHEAHHRGQLAAYLSVLSRLG